MGSKHLHVLFSSASLALLSIAAGQRGTSIGFNDSRYLQILHAAVPVSYYGVTGDGVTDDTLAMRSALASGHNLAFRYGDTYLINGSLYLYNSNITIYGNGAQIRRASQVSTTITGAVSGTTTVIPVTTTTGFKVGQSVTLTHGGGIGRVYVSNPGSGYTTAPSWTASNGGAGTTQADTNTGRVIQYTTTSAGSNVITEPIITLSGGGGSGATALCEIGTTDDANSAASITAIDTTGLTITVSAHTWSATFNSGDTLYTCGKMISLQGDRDQVVGPLTIDGNMSNNAINRWQTTIGVELLGTHCSIRDVRLQNMGGDGIALDSSYNTVERCVLDTLNGNGVHFGNSSPTSGHCKCLQSDVHNCNLDPTVGHVSGGIIYSANITDGLIDGCSVDTTPICGIGSLQTISDSDGTISNCTARNCGLAGIGTVSTNNSSAPQQWVISNCRIYGCGHSYLDAAVDISNTNGNFVNRFLLSNIFIDCTTSYANGLRIQKGQYISVIGLQAISTQAGSNRPTGVTFGTSSGNDAPAHITLSSCIVNSFVDGFSATGGAATPDVVLSGCIALNPSGYGFRFGDVGTNNPGISLIGCKTSWSSNNPRGFYIRGNTHMTNCEVSCGNNTTLAVELQGSNSSIRGLTILSSFTNSPTTGVQIDSGSTNVDYGGNTITPNAATALNTNGCALNTRTTDQGSFSLFKHTSTVGNSTNTETTTYSDTIPGSQLASVGQSIEFKYAGTQTTSGTAAREWRVYFDGTGATSLFDSGSVSSSSSMTSWELRGTIIEVSTSSVNYVVTLTTDGATPVSITKTGTLNGLTLSSSNVLKQTVQNTDSGNPSNNLSAILGWVRYNP